MALSVKLRTVITGIGDAIDATDTIAGTGGFIISETLSTPADVEVTCAFTLAQLKLFALLSDKALTVKTNNATSPQESLSLAANVPFVYKPGAGLDSPFAGDVTALFVSGTGAIVLQGRVEIDATP